MPDSTRPRQGIPRRRRLIRLTAALGALLVLGLVMGVWLALRPAAEHKPGEAVEGLTSDLARTLPPDYPRVSFADVTSAAGIAFRHFQGRRSSHIAEDVGSGAAWGDYDGDGWLDLFVVNEVGPVTLSEADRRRSPARGVLYHNNGDGSFTDVTDRSGIEARGWGMGAAWADYDNDGRLDLVISNYGTLALWHNAGGGSFTERSRQSGLGKYRGLWTGLAWGDYDRDGFLDLYVTGYVKVDDRQSGPAASEYDIENPASINPSAFPPERNLLFHNNRDRTFTERAAAAGVLDSLGRGMAATWCDFDEDGWPDLYVANDLSDNAMFRNLGGKGKFADISHIASVADYRSSMGIAVGDWNGDGHQDLFLTHWLAQENALYANLLTEPGGSLRFRDEADRFGLGQIALDFVSWGTSFFDYDNDGNLDLLVVNGSTLQDRSDPTRLVPMRSQLFWNRGPEAGFYDTSPVGGSYFQQSYGGRGAAFADYDNDGDVDVFVVNHGGPAVLLRNDGGNRNRWLSVELRGKRSNPQGIGATIRVTAGGHTQVRQVGCQASYLSQNSLIETFGLGAISQADTVEVIWPSKIRQRRTGVAANQRIQIIEDEDPANPEPEAASAGTERERITEFWSRYREATALRIAGKIAEAARGYDRALALNGRHEDGLYYLGSLQLELGNFPEAERAWQRLAAVNPGSARAHSRLGALYLCLDPGAPFSPARAIEQFRRAHEINKEETGPLLHLAEASILGGDPTGAAGYLVAVLGSNASSPPANFYQGYLAWKTGRAEPARAAFARAMQGAALAAPGLPTGATQEGDTRKGATDSSENGGYCGALARLSAGLGGIAPGELGSEMERRYRALDRLIAPGR